MWLFFIEDGFFIITKVKTTGRFAGSSLKHFHEESAPDFLICYPGCLFLI